MTLALGIRYQLFQRMQASAAQATTSGMTQPASVTWPGIKLFQPHLIVFALPERELIHLISAALQS